MRFNSETYRAFDDNYDFGEFLGHLIEEEIDEGKELRGRIDNFLNASTDKRVHLDLCEDINALVVVAQDVALAVGFVLGRDLPLEYEPAICEAEMIRNKLRTSGIYDRLLGLEPKRKGASPVEKVLWALENPAGQVKKN
jgi:hypothetical protein